jgi:predicted enzyme related to lactoylglutathione lyase
MLNDMPLRVSIPVVDMARAKQFYQEKLGLNLLDEHQYATVFETLDSQLALVPSQNVIPAKHSLVTWMVEDIQAQVAALHQVGIELEEYDLADIKMVDGVAQLGNDLIAWFRDSEGNLLAVAELHNA